MQIRFLDNLIRKTFPRMLQLNIIFRGILWYIITCGTIFFFSCYPMYIYMIQKDYAIIDLSFLYDMNRAGNREKDQGWCYPIKIMCNLCVLPQGKILRTGRNLNLGWNILKWAISMHRKVYFFNNVEMKQWEEESLSNSFTRNQQPN